MSRLVYYYFQISLILPFFQDVPLCENLTDCKSCTNNGCYWCGKNRKCMEASASSSPQPCGYNAESCGTASTSDCWKNSETQCPDVPVCETLTNCYNCTSNGCYWCGLNQKCMESSSSSFSPSPCGYKNESCGSASTSDCWKGNPSQCPVSYYLSTLFA